jgi:hypothetical protein
MELPQIIERQIRLVVELPVSSEPQEVYVSDLSGTFQVSPIERTFIIQNLRGRAHMKGLVCPLRVHEATGTFTMQRSDGKHSPRKSGNSRPTSKNMLFWHFRGFSSNPQFEAFPIVTALRNADFEAVGSRIEAWYVNATSDVEPVCSRPGAENV